VRWAEVGLNPGAERFLHELQFAGKEMVGLGHHHQFGWRHCLGHRSFDFRLRAEFVFRAG